MRTSIAVSIAAAALTAVAIGWSGELFTRSRGPAPAVRDHRPANVVCDDRPAPPFTTTGNPQAEGA